AITSCWVSRSISSILLTSKLAFPFILLKSSGGIAPLSKSTSQTASSISSHLRYLFSSVQIRPISGRVYRSIIFFSPRGADESASKQFLLFQQSNNNSNAAETQTGQ